MQLLTAPLPALFISYAATAASTVRHFYTSDSNGEYARSVGFHGASVLWVYGLSQQLPGTVPLYRCRHQGANLYLLIIHAGCEGAGGFVLEGNTMFIYANQVPGTNPLDRYVNSQADHMYVRRDWYSNHPGHGFSCDCLAILTLARQWGFYVQEGTTGYILASPGAHTLPLYGFAQGRHSDRDPCAR